MIYRFCIELDDWEDLCSLEQKKVQWNAIRALVLENVYWLAAHPDAPLLYESGCVYIPENQPFVLNCWSNIPRVIELGGSHCVGLTAWRVAELRIRFKEDARPAILEFHDESPIGLLQEFHFVVKRGDGSLEDPSRQLGMP